MQTNNSIFRGLRKIRTIIICVVFFLAGLLFVGLGVYGLLNPGEEADQTADFVCIAMGAISASIAVVSLIIHFKRSKAHKPLTEQEVNEKLGKNEQFDLEEENLKDTKLYFHLGGKMNQSYFLENRNGKTVCECRLVKFNLLSACTYEIVNHENGHSKTIKIGKTMTSGDEYGALGSNFKLDGVDCWEWLHQRGYEIKQYVLTRRIVEVSVLRFGKTIAKFVPTNFKDPWNEEGRDILKMMHGFFRIEVIDANLEDMLIAAIIYSKVELVE